ncbi:MAG: hypothetical protein AAF387_16090 [Pseudomonadota bacterium]
MISKLLGVFGFVAFLVGCGSVSPIPSDTFYRFEKVAEGGGAGVDPWSESSIIVSRIRATGIYKDRAIAQLAADGVSLKQSKYNYWNDSPEIMVQQRLFSHAQRLRLAPTVSLENHRDAEFVIGGRLLRLERTVAPSGIAVELLLNVKRAESNEKMLFERRFARQATTDDETPKAAVKLISQSLDDIITQFIEEAGQRVHATP